MPGLFSYFFPLDILLLFFSLYFFCNCISLPIIKLQLFITLPSLHYSSSISCLHIRISIFVVTLLLSISIAPPPISTTTWASPLFYPGEKAEACFFYETFMPDVFTFKIFHIPSACIEHVGFTYMDINGTIWMLPAPFPKMRQFSLYVLIGYEGTFDIITRLSMETSHVNSGSYL